MSKSVRITINFVPPKAVQEAAARGLALRKQFGRGGMSTQEAGAQGIGSGLARASSLARGQAQAPRTIRRMKSYFDRHESDKQGEDWNNTERPSNGKIAWLLWGDDVGRAWVKKLCEQMDANGQAAHKIKVTRKPKQQRDDDHDYED